MLEKHLCPSWERWYYNLQTSYFYLLLIGCFVLSGKKFLNLVFGRLDFDYSKKGVFVLGYLVYIFFNLLLVTLESVTNVSIISHFLIFI